MGKAKKNPALKVRKLVGDRLESPSIDWANPPSVVPFPRIENLVNLDDHQKLLVLQRFGIAQSWTEAEMDAARYIQRVSSRQWTKAELKAEVQRIAGFDSVQKTGTSRAIRSAAKRTYREYGMLHALGRDDPKKAQWIRMAEGGLDMCDSCDELAGSTGTLAYHESIGMPGEASCEGGPECRCPLLRYD